jgi:spore maturation protein CgeB
LSTRVRIVIFGLTVSSSWGNGHATLWRALCDALGRLGHDVTFFERDVPYYARHRDLIEPSTYRVILYPSWQTIEREIVQELGGADAALVTSYCPDASAAAQAMLASVPGIRAFYDLDTPVTLERLRTHGAVEYLPACGLDAFDLVLSYTGGRALDELCTRLGARRVAPLYGSVDPAAHRPVTPISRYQADLSYLGTYAHDRQDALERLFIEPARRMPTRRFVIGGALYPSDFPWTHNMWFLSHVSPPEHPLFYSSSALTLSVTRMAMAQMGYCPSGRLFEAAACGTPVVTDWWEGLEMFFEPGREILVASSAAHVIEFLSLDPEERRRIGTAARRRALGEHTAEHRARQLGDMLRAA